MLLHAETTEAPSSPGNQGACWLLFLQKDVLGRTGMCWDDGAEPGAHLSDDLCTEIGPAFAAPTQSSSRLPLPQAHGYCNFLCNSRMLFPPCSWSPAWEMSLLLPGPQKGKLITKEFAMAQGHTTN